MTLHDFAPYSPTAIGFDRLMGLLDAAAGWENPATGYPPYNIEKADDDFYRITLAVAGYECDDLTVEQRENTLVVSGRHESEAPGGTYLYRGLSVPEFQRSFQLADYVRVEDASLENGLLRIDLHRELPEELKPRRVEIATGPRKFVGKAKKLIQGSKNAA